MEKKIVIADLALLTEVKSAGSRAELCDPAGQTVGVVLTADEYKKMRRNAGEIEFTPEYLAEIDRAVANGEYKTTAQVLEMLARIDKALEGAL